MDNTPWWEVPLVGKMDGRNPVSQKSNNIAIRFTIIFLLEEGHVDCCSPCWVLGRQLFLSWQKMLDQVFLKAKQKARGEAENHSPPRRTVTAVMLLG